MNRTTKRTRPLQPCGCGCGQTSRWINLNILKGPDGRRYHVLDDCRDEFIEELDAMDKLKVAVAGMGRMFFLSRWRFARLVFALQLRINVRRFGWKVARSAARRSVALLCLPKWLAVIVAKRWKRPV